MNVESMTYKELKKFEDVIYPVRVVRSELWPGAFNRSFYYSICNDFESLAKACNKEEGGETKARLSVRVAGADMDDLATYEGKENVQKFVNEMKAVHLRIIEIDEITRKHELEFMS